MRSIDLALPLLLAALAPTAPAQIQIGPQVRVDAGRGPAACNETTIAVSPLDPLELVAGWNDYREPTVRTGVGISMDGGHSWTDFLLRPPLQFQAGVEGDPMTAVDPRTGTLFAGGISFAFNGGIYVARKGPGAAGFEPSVMARVTGSADKGWMAAGPIPGVPDSTRLYIAYNQGLIHSSDLGQTWTAPQSLGSGIGFLPRVGPGGELYVCYWDFGFGVDLIRSFDGGATLSSPIRIATRMDSWGTGSTNRIPGSFRVPILNYLAVDPNDGTLYVVYFDTTSTTGGNANVDLYFCKSTDQGSTWTVPVVINGDSNPPGDQFFPWIEVDEESRLHLLFYDTRGIAQNDSAQHALIHAYYAYSEDGGASWSEHQLTSTPMDSSLAFGNGIFIGDYSGLAAAAGRAWPLYMATPLGDADVFTHVIEHSLITNYCAGTGCPCGNDDPSAGCGNHGLDGDPSTGASLAASGGPSVAADDLQLSLQGLQPLQAGLIYAGSGEAAVPFGDGLRCLSSPFFRYPARSADASGAIHYGPGEIVAIATGFGSGGQVQPGSTWRYQGWYRDPNGPCGMSFNLTDAVRVPWQP